MKNKKSIPDGALASARPFIDRFLFIGALLGVLLTVHIWTQQNTGFANGCLGFDAPNRIEAMFNCQAVIGSDVGSILGIPYAILGFGFYLVIAVLGFAVNGATGERLANIRRFRGGMIGAGFLFSAYLVYVQFFVIEQLCALCLLSAGLLTLLLGAVAYDYLKPAQPAVAKAMKQQASRRDFRLYSVLALAAVVLAGADVLYYRNVEAAALDQGVPQVQHLVGDDGQCFYNPEQSQAFDFTALLSQNDPGVGPQNASVTIVEFFDPNCPYCAVMNEMMRPIVGKYSDRVRFVYKPVALWEVSNDQVSALFAAHREGKFNDLMDLQMERQVRGGMSRDQLAQIITDSGLSPAEVFSQIDAGAFVPVLMQNRNLAVSAGVRGVPAVYINGWAVQTRTAECMDRMIEAALNK
jgi:uncharacterized membrane protein/protein-disulfide isomerase